MKPVEVLQKWWGYSSFRPLQESIIERALSGEDTLAILPTGGGKSVCFQVPAMCREGLAIVVTPLISLMRDQVEHLEMAGIRALAIYSGMSYHEIDTALDNARYGDYKFLYVSPERLRTDLFKARVATMDVNFIVVDEAHCICQWGYDFRPDYLLLSNLREILPDVPVIALTASATPDVAQDIMDKLGFRGRREPICSGFERSNLSYVVRECEDKFGQLLRLCNNVVGTGIVYVRERVASAKIASFLLSQGVAADFYHAGLSTPERTAKQKRWMEGDTRVIVATNAFGMGIDKSDVRWVCHFDLPDSLEAYYQEAGRAGRDGKPSYALLLWNKGDMTRMTRICQTSFPPLDYIAGVYQKIFQYLGFAYEEGQGRSCKFDLMDFARKFRLHAATAYYALKYIESCGYWTLTDELDNPSRVMFTVGRDELYRVQLGSNRLDTFIKALMRIYPALFSHPVRIDEGYIARTTPDSEAGVKEKLMELSRMHVLQYIPRDRSPYIILHNERLTPDNLFLSPTDWERRRNVFKTHLESMYRYISPSCSDDNPACRQKRICAYFGQKDAKECGKCDMCRK